MSGKLGIVQSNSKIIQLKQSINGRSTSHKRIRICIRCQNPIPNKNRCDICNIKFHDSFAIKILKKLIGIEPK